MEYYECAPPLRKEENVMRDGDEHIAKSQDWSSDCSHGSTNQLKGASELQHEEQLNSGNPLCIELLGLDGFNKYEKRMNLIYKNDVKNDSLEETGSDHKQLCGGLITGSDFTDLSFLTNDLLLGDSNYFEQASQLVDPALNVSESTPFSFNNNNDLVQLLKLGLADSRDDDVHNTLINKNYEDLIWKKNFPNKCERIFNRQPTTAISKIEQCNFPPNIQFMDANVNINRKIKHQMEVKGKNKSERKVLCSPIKRGRRYLPNFKKEVLEYAKSHTFKETALQFQINSNTITEWSRNNDNEKQSVMKSGTDTVTEKSSSSYKNHKTDLHGTPIRKTEVILLNYDLSLETEQNEALFKTIKEDIPFLSSSSSSSSLLSSQLPGDIRPEEKFFKWIERKRLQRKELSRQQVFHIARYCMKKWPATKDTSQWFVLWLKRYNRVLNSVNSNIEVEKYIKYPNRFKLEVVLYARLFTKNSAARVFNVSRKRTFDWFSRLIPAEKEPFAENGETDTWNFNVKKDRTKDKIYSELHLWYEKMVLTGNRPTSNDIKKKAKEIFVSHGMKEIKFSDGWLQKFCQRMNIKLRHGEDDHLLLWVLTQFDNNVSLSHQEITEKSSSLVGRKKFKGSKGWTLRFLKRHKNLLQRCPTCADQLPRITHEKLIEFWQSFKQNLTSFRMREENIGCMDEIPLNFGYPEEGKSTSLPLLRKTGFENCQGIVILSMLANGRLLPPVVVFKGTDLKQQLPGPNLNILILSEEKGHITADILETWVSDVWLRYAPSPSALVVDSFEPHRAKAFARLLEKENCSLHVIPDGCSSKYQPLDVEVTPLFKETIREQWKEFLLVDSGLCSSRRCRFPERDTIIKWIQNAFEKVNRNPISIINSFKTTGRIDHLKEKHFLFLSVEIWSGLGNLHVTVPLRPKGWFVRGHFH